MSVYGYLNCHDCRQTLWLGKALHRDGRPVAFQIGGPEEPPHWERKQLDQVLWKFLADHTAHRIDVRLEHEMTAEMFAYQYIGGDTEEDLSFDAYLAGWPAPSGPAPGAAASGAAASGAAASGAGASVDGANTPRMFRTLRGFLSGDEPDEANYFHFSVTLRIHGEGVPFVAISERLGVEPTHIHRKGERRGAHSPAWRDDAWHFEPALPETEPLEHHIEALWALVQPHVEYLKALKNRFKVDVFCGYRSNCDTAGFVVSHKCLSLFTALEVPFGVSVIIA